MNQRPEILAGLDALLAPRYSIQTEVGRGATAVVYLAEDRKHQRSVAIKLLRPELAQALGPDRFLREIRISAGLTHANIVPVYDSGQVGGTLYYVMPLVEGESLRARLERDGPLPLADVVTITSAVAAALDHAHAQAIVHRDLKPENILLAEGRALVSDFGVARATAGYDGTPGLTEPGLAVGTPHYMSPEQAAADPRIDARSDQYSLGVVVYETLTGEPPFRSASPRAVLARKVADEVPPIRTVREAIPRAVEDVVMRALARVPGDRFASAGEFAAALERASTGARSTMLSGGHFRTLSRRRGSVAAVLIVLIAPILWLLLPTPAQPPAALPGSPGRVAMLPFVLRLSPAHTYIGEALMDDLERAIVLFTDIVGRDQAIRAEARLELTGLDQYEREERIAADLEVDRWISGRITQNGDSIEIAIAIHDGNAGWGGIVRAPIPMGARQRRELADTLMHRLFEREFAARAELMRLLLSDSAYSGARGKDRPLLTPSRTP